MTARPKPPADFDENPELDAEFFRRAQPALPGEAARMRTALEQIIVAHDGGGDLERAIEGAREALEGPRRLLMDL